MTTAELEILIKQGEGYNTEFKRAIPSKASDLADEICAFANAAGGTVLVGIDDDGKTVGITMDNVTRSRLQNVFNTIEPRVEVTMQEIEKDGKTVLCLQCQSGKSKPYIVSGNIFVRNGPNSEKITSANQMREFFQLSDRIFFDEGICRNFNYPQDFNDEFFNEFLSKAGISSSLPRETLIENLQLVYDDLKFKNGAALFFGRNPQKFFPQAITRCLLFKGTDKVHIMDDKTFEGNLMEQYNGAYAYLYQKLNLNYIIEGAGPRKEILEIPEEALKEALVNALCHRDYYERGAVTHVEIYDDRVEITNTGGLVHSILKEDFGTKSLSRNSLVFGLFLRMDMVEKVGSGINRMKEEMAKANLPEPYFGLEGFFTVRFYRPVEFGKWIELISNNLTDKQALILREINTNPNITLQELAASLNITQRTVERNVAILRGLELLERVGSRKDGYYKIKMNRL
ncbi:MAG: HTH domain-containing protein [Chryseobacterium sp.]|nr:MAG: HTH domain-containing protein [Chryseobacterium sp.]